MKNLSLLMLFLFSSTTFAGGIETGNGGGGFVCRDQNNEIVEIYWLDLLEAQVRNQWEFPVDEDFGTLSGEQIARTTIEKIKEIAPGFYKRLSKAFYESSPRINRALEKMRKSVEIVGREISLKEIKDSYRDLKPEGCDYRQIINYGKNKVEVNSVLFDAMSRVAKAAAYLHEAAYLVDRRYHGAKDSVRARQWVARLLCKSCNLSKKYFPRSKSRTSNKVPSLMNENRATYKRAKKIYKRLQRTSVEELAGRRWVQVAYINQTKAFIDPKRDGSSFNGWGRDITFYQDVAEIQSGPKWSQKYIKRPLAKIKQKKHDVYILELAYSVSGKRFLLQRTKYRCKIYTRSQEYLLCKLNFTSFTRHGKVDLRAPGYHIYRRRDATLR